MNRMKRKLALAAVPVLIIAAALVLSPGRNSWYVGDDFVESGYAQGSHLAWGQWYHAYFGQMSYRGVAITSYWYSFTYLEPIGNHLIDFGLHGLSAIFLFFLIRALWRRPDRQGARPETAALLGALLFAVHPIGARTAVWIACRADLFGTCFALAALWAAASDLRPARKLPLVGLLALLALMSKESQIVIAAAVLVVALAREDAGPWRARARAAALTAAPAFAATAVYLVTRYLALRGLGGYTQLPPTVGGKLAALAWHLPRLLHLSFADYLFHHYRSEPFLMAGLKAAAVALLFLAAPSALWREKRLLLAGLGLILVYLVPLWNFSHMMFAREERMLYSGLIGAALIFAAVAGAPRHAVLRPVAAAAALIALAGLGLWSQFQVGEWTRVGDDNHRLARALADYAEKAGPNSTARRIYVLGLPPEHYYLDDMVKLELSGVYRDRFFLTADQPGFFWQNVAAKKFLDLPESVPAEARPTRESHPCLPDMVFETLTPPDLVLAAAVDPWTRVLEWDGRQLREFTDDFKQVYQQRLHIRQNLEFRPNLLPSYGFRLNFIPFDWTLAPGLKVTVPDEMTRPYLFTAADHDAWMVSPRVQLPTLAAGRFTLGMTLPPRSFLPPGEDQGCFMWKSKLDLQYGRERTICFPLIADGREHEYSVALDQNPWWPLAGEIASFRVDPVAYPTTFQLTRMEFLPR